MSQINGSQRRLCDYRHFTNSRPPSAIQALNMDSGLATSSVDAARVEAGIAYLAGNYCRARALCPCIVGMS